MDALDNIDIESIMEEVINRSFEAVDLADIESYCKEPASTGKNMERLQDWYQKTVANEWEEYYAKNDCNNRNENVDTESESDDIIWNSSNCDDDESISSQRTAVPYTEITSSDQDDDGEIYCFCRRPNNEQPMVACEGVGCKYLWFHFGCVGLPLSWTSKEMWLCPKCRES